MRTNRTIAATRDDVRQALGFDAEVVVRERAHPAPAKVRHEFAPGSPALELGVPPDIVDLLEVFLVPGSGAADGERWRVDGV